MSDWLPGEKVEPPEGFVSDPSREHFFKKVVVLSPTAFDEIETKIPMICRYAPSRASHPGPSVLVVWFPGGLSVHFQRGEAP